MTRTECSRTLIIRTFRLSELACLVPFFFFININKKGWLDKFKNRHGIINLSTQEEILSAAEETDDPLSRSYTKWLRKRVRCPNKSTMLTRLDFSRNVYRKGLSFPVTIYLLQDPRKQRTCFFLCLQ